MSKSQEKRHAALKGIPPATEDDLKLDLERLYAVADVGEPELIRLAHHWKQEAERRVDPLDPDFKIALAYEERITTLEAALRETVEALAMEHCHSSAYDAPCEVCQMIDRSRARTEVSDTEENPTKHEYRRCPMCGRCAECGEENPTDD